MTWRVRSSALATLYAPNGTDPAAASTSVLSLQLAGGYAAPAVYANATCTAANATAGCTAANATAADPATAPPPLLVSLPAAVVVNGSVSGNSYREAVRVALPPGLAAGSYTLWGCVPSLGCGLMADAIVVAPEASLGLRGAGRRRWGVAGGA